MIYDILTIAQIDTQIDDVGVSWLADALKVNNTLNILDFESEFICIILLGNIE